MIYIRSFLLEIPILQHVYSVLIVAIIFPIIQSLYKKIKGVRYYE